MKKLFYLFCLLVFMASCAPPPQKISGHSDVKYVSVGVDSSKFVKPLPSQSFDEVYSSYPVQNEDLNFNTQSTYYYIDPYFYGYTSLYFYYSYYSYYYPYWGFGWNWYYPYYYYGYYNYSYWNSNHFYPHQGLSNLYNRPGNIGLSTIQNKNYNYRSTQKVSPSNRVSPTNRVTPTNRVSPNKERYQYQKQNTRTANPGYNKNVQNYSSQMYRNLKTNNSYEYINNRTVKVNSNNSLNRQPNRTSQPYNRNNYNQRTQPNNRSTQPNYQRSQPNNFSPARSTSPGRSSFSPSPRSSGGSFSPSRSSGGGGGGGTRSGGGRR